MYLQVQEQKGTDAELHPRDWGWQECEKGFVPLQTVLPPEHLLQVVGCYYQTDYSTLRCSHKKLNNEWTPSCGNCKGTGCTSISHDNDIDTFE